MKSALIGSKCRLLEVEERIFKMRDGNKGWLKEAFVN
jgi:hypothetical protein